MNAVENEDGAGLSGPRFNRHFIDMDRRCGQFWLADYQ